MLVSYVTRVAGWWPRQADFQHVKKNFVRHLSTDTSLIERLENWKVARSLRQSLTKSPFHFRQLTDVQERVFGLLPELAEASPILKDGKGRDMLCKARTGTGKTVAFLVPAIQARIHALEKLNEGELRESFRNYLEKKHGTVDVDTTSSRALRDLQREFRFGSVGTLVISPTRELAMQIADEAKKLTERERKMHVHILVGGVKSIRQRRPWDLYPKDIVVATPGRLLDLLSIPSFREAISTTQTLVLDEADMLLELGFREDIQSIISHLPSNEQRTTFLFSATMDPSIAEVARASLHENHRFIDCVPPGEDSVHKRIPQTITTLQDPSDIVSHIVRLVAHDQLMHGPRSKIMLFTSTTKLTDMLANMFQTMLPTLPGSKNTQIFRIHSMLDQGKRSRISQKFRECNDRPSIMFTSDVSARGVDYPSVTRVIQLGVPPSKAMYVHRVGRTGRRGRDGRADLVIMDFESAFVAFQLDDMPLEPLDPTSLAHQVDQLAKDADQAPPSTLVAPMASRLVSLESVWLPKAQSRVEPDAVKGVFSGLFGYYYSLRQMLRTSNAHILASVQSLIQGILCGK
ncbi:RNA helicase [Malassezia nana]|uniref:ATP-dependent RNA helicase n=1 Tax=Malassezia nana TaxID=180528 RepID=A0AAF0EKH4_9BASI|nr:RNA helicase [Malassezia nana]